MKLLTNLNCFIPMQEFKLECSLSERSIKSKFRKVIFRERIQCPHCDTSKIRMVRKRYWCPRCRLFFSLTSHTWLAGMKFTWKTLYLLLACWLNNYSVNVTQDLTKISRPTIYHWFRKFRLHAPQLKAYFSQERMVVDETYFGGHKKGIRGRGSLNKTPVLGAVGASSGHLVTETFQNFDQLYLVSFLKRHTHKKIPLLTDCYKTYWPLKKRYGYSNHQMINHAYRFKETNLIETCWSVMKRRLRQTYHHATKEKMPEYVAEMTYRFNTRKNPDSPLEFLQKSLFTVSNALH